MSRLEFLSLNRKLTEDTPELFWSEASLYPLYEAIREYLEIGPRAQVLNDRLSVAGDLVSCRRQDACDGEERKADLKKGTAWMRTRLMAA